MSSTDADFRCGLCNKTYSRRDLRDRHRRRCVKTFGQERTSKRKSCVSCAQKKLRCSLTRPNCTRCVHRNTPCRYPNASSAEDIGQMSTESTPTDLTANIPVSVTTLSMEGSNGDSSVYEIPELHSVDFINRESGVQWPDIESGFDVLNLSPQFFLQEKQPLNISSTLLPGDTLQPLLSSSSSSQYHEPFIDDVETSPFNSSGDKGVFANNFFPHLSRDATGLVDELLDIIHDYPQMMLQRDFWSPFIHHNLYRCSQEGMAEPLGIVLACVSAYLNSVNSSYEYVAQMLNSHRERLVNEFSSYVDRPETSLAAIHAVCVYQILGFFCNPPPDGPKPSTNADLEKRQRQQGDQAKAAELHVPFLIKMARRLCHAHKKALLHNDAGWSEWKYAESLRRNIFFVHIVNILATKARKLHHDYFEPLNDATVLQLPLPAPEAMWRACSQNEWLVARELARQTPLSLCTLQDLIDLDHAGRLNVVSLAPLSRIILVCHKLQPESSLGGD